MARQKLDRNVSPVGWYVAMYVLRFVELDDPDKDDPGAQFLLWENTILVKATDLDSAYDRAVEIAKENCEPYKGGNEGVAVQWVFEGITEVVPVYEELEDGAEIMWSEREGVTLREIRKLVRKKGEFAQ
jgi:hypothetical protein